MRRPARIAACVALAAAISCSGARPDGQTVAPDTGPVGVYVRGADMEEMEEALDAALASDPDNPLLLTLAGDAAYYRADFDAAMDYLGRAIVGLPAWNSPLRDPVGEMALVSLHSLKEYAPDYESRLAGIHASALPGLYETTDAAYFVALTGRIKALAREGRFEDSRSLVRDGGCLVDWKGVGPFGPTEVLHFEHAHAPETDIPWKATYVQGPGEDPTATQDARSLFCNVRLEPENVFRGGTYYAATDVTVHRDGDYVFRMFSSHSTTVLVDGVPVFTVDRRFEIHPDIVFFRLPLRRGEHTVTLKMGTRSPMPGFSFMWKEAAATGPDPSASPAITSRRHGGGFASMAPPPGPATPVDLPGATSEVEAVILSELALFRGDPAAVHDYLDPLMEAHPSSATVLPRVMTMEWNDPHAPYPMRMNRVRAVAEKTLGLHPTLWISAYLLARIESNLGRTEEAIDLLKQALEDVEPFAGYHITLAGLYSYKGWVGESVEAMTRAAELLSGNCLARHQEYRIAQNFGDLDGMEAAARSITTCDATDGTLLEILISRQKWEEAEKEQARLHGLFPDRDEHLLDQALMSLKLGDTDTYMQLLGRYNTLHPDDYIVIDKLVDEHAAAGRTGEAVALLEKARGTLEGPTDDISMKIAYLEGYDYLYPFRRDAHTAIAAYEADHGGETESGNQSVEILDHVTHRIFPDGSSLTRYHSVRKMLTREGVEAHSEFSAPGGAALIQLRTIKADGRVLQPENIANKMTLSFPALEPGDYTEAEWIQAEGASTIYPGGFSLARWYFQVLDLVLYLSEMIVVAPADMPLELNPRGTPPPAEVMTEGPLKVMRWTARNMPHRKGEPASPNFSEFLPSLQLSHDASWDRYFEWVADILVDADKVSPRLEKQVAEIVGDIPPDDGEARARALYRWVTDEIDEGEGIDAPVAFILEERVGNRARLLRAMLGEAGVPSELWVVRSSYADHTETTVPNFNVYSLFAVKVGMHWLVPFAESTPYGTLPYAMRGEEAVRLFPSHATGQTPGDDAFDDSITRAIDIHVLPSGRSEAVLTETFRGLEAALMRAALKQLPKSELEKELEGSYLARMFTGASLTGLTLPDLEEASDTLTLEITFTLPAMPGPFPGAIALGPFLKSHLSKIWTQLPERHFPLLIDEPTTYHIEVTIRTDGNWYVFQPPAPATSLDTKHGGHFEQSYTEKKGVVTLTREVSLPSGRVSPDDYAELLDFTTRIDENEGGVFILMRKL
jgi:tetratricopeptide (TPR) repeat protein